jgi:hypothetical protein
METIGKVLSITLLTIFGSAAATVYLVDSNKMSSFLSNAPVSYTSDERKPENESKLFNDTYYRDRANSKYSEPIVERDEPEGYSEVKPIWGQSYDTDPVSTYATTERAQKLAEENSIDSIKKNMEQWKARYDNDLKSGRSRNADIALRNYSEYKKALEFK